MAESGNGHSVNSGWNSPRNNGHPPKKIDLVIDEINENSAGLCEEQRNHLQDILKDVTAICESDRFNDAISSDKVNMDDNSSMDKTIRTVMRFTGKVLLKGGELVPLPAKIILTVVAAVINYLSEEDLVFEVTKKFRSVLDEVFLRRCEASCNSFLSCASYIKGMPNPRNLQSDQKRLYLSRMAADMPVYTGIMEIEELHSDIKKAINATDLPDITSLMRKVEMYCCLTTFRELFLLARFVVEKEYNIDTQSIINVYEVQRHRDHVLLCFLYRPNFTNVDAFLMYDSNRWPVVREFLERRQFIRNTERLDNKLFIIRSVCYPDTCLSDFDLTFLSLFWPFLDTKGEHTIFRLKNIHSDVYTMHPHTCLHHFSINTAFVYSREWRIIRIEPDTTGEPVPYLLTLNSNQNLCVYVSCPGRVDLKKRKKGDRKCLWFLEEI